MTKTGFIYSIRNPVAGYAYVGSTINWKNRKAVHRFYLKKIYGSADDFVFEILETVEYEDKSELRAKEREWIIAEAPNQNIYLR